VKTRAKLLLELHAVLRERVERSAEETDRLQTWLKSAQAKDLARHSPELKEAFSGAGTVGENAVQRASCSPLGGGKRIGQDQVAIGSFSRQVRRVWRGFDPDVVSLRRV
jgi:argininosuccinate lyase